MQEKPQCRIRANGRFAKITFPDILIPGFVHKSRLHCTIFSGMNGKVHSTYYDSPIKEEDRLQIEYPAVASCITANLAAENVEPEHHVQVDFYELRQELCAQLTGVRNGEEHKFAALTNLLKNSPISDKGFIDALEKQISPDFADLAEKYRQLETLTLPVSLHAMQGLRQFRLDAAFVLKEIRELQKNQPPMQR